MKIKLQKIEQQLIIIIPETFAQQHDLDENSKVEIQPITADLETLLAHITNDNLHPEIVW